MDCAEANHIEEKYPGKLNDICEEIAEMLWDRARVSSLEEGEDGYVWVADIQDLNVCNQAITGTFWIDGTEYSFEAECGDWNGWVWRSISADAPVPTIEIHHTKWALEPNNELVGDALMKGEGKFLIAKWDALISREPCKSIPGSYSYDRHFQPGGSVETHWKDKAAKYGFVLVDQETANETRARLSGAN